MDFQDSTPFQDARAHGRSCAVLTLIMFVSVATPEHSVERVIQLRVAKVQRGSLFP